MYNRKKDIAYVPLLSVAPPLGRLQTQSSVQPRRISPAPRSRAQGTIAPGQPLPAGRQRDKFVPLPEEEEDNPPLPNSLPHSELYSASLQQPTQQLPPSQQHGVNASSIYTEELQDDSRRGRITFYCVAESFDRKKLESILKITYPPGTVLSYPDVFYVEYIKGTDDYPGGDVYFFDYGVVACWGMTKTQEMTIVRGIAVQCMNQPLPDREIEVDEFQYNYTAFEKSHVQNDTVTLHKRYSQDHKMKLAISYALAQSTKLSVYEKRVTDIVLETKNLPEALAERGEVDISGNDIAKLIGKVFLQKSAVNLLSSVLDTPEFFWHAPDSFQNLYERVTEYLELPTRVELLNSRFAVLQEMLDMLRDHQNNFHNVRLEWIVIWLIVVEVLVGLFELLGLFGVVGKGHSRR
uniref:DUF155 domain-containing protein n=1 Tax=Polytomella parva TaxID=51329 RepID=A0A6U0V7E2_9CHLO|mmetsp:Transcript_21357/g.38159  ORF Transcript_21357/g.38159 Transcript_21357/m.38159 type:complete len:407 (+) Transcript_21357:146-1366(+)